MAKKRPSTSVFLPALFPYIQQASDDTLRNRLAAYQDEMRQSVLDKADALKNEYPCDYR